MDNRTPPPPSSDYFADSNNNGETGDYSLGFMELLNMQDFGPSLSDVFIQEYSPNIQAQAQESLQMSNAPPTPNSSSVSSESNDARNDDVVKQAVDRGEAEQHRKTNKQPKSKKIIEKKRQREPRFAFMTKSEVDHLEDGYRWRKYGQKAVKNSHFPRSYYRCTTASCNVKKMVERSFNDPSIVVTTYEGQHTHGSSIIARSSITAAVPPYSAFSSGCAAPYPSPQMLLSAHHIPFCSNPFAFLTDHDGLVQDVGPWSAVKREG